MLASAVSLASWPPALCLSGAAVVPSCVCLSFLPPNGRVRRCYLWVPMVTQVREVPRLAQGYAAGKEQS